MNGAAVATAPKDPREQGLALTLQQTQEYVGELWSLLHEIQEKISGPVPSPEKRSETPQARYAMAAAGETCISVAAMVGFCKELLQRL